MECEIQNTDHNRSHGQLDIHVLRRIETLTNFSPGSYYSG